jgi:transcription elongation factor Elf1
MEDDVMDKQQVTKPIYKTERTKCPICESESLWEDAPYNMREISCGSCGFEWYERIETNQPETSEGGE